MSGVVILSRSQYSIVKDRKLRNRLEVQWSLYFKTTHGTKKMWSSIAGGKIKVIYDRKLPFGTKTSGIIIKGGLKIEGIEGCKIEGLLYVHYNHTIQYINF